MPNIVNYLDTLPGVFSSANIEGEDPIIQQIYNEAKYVINDALIEQKREALLDLIKQSNTTL